MLSTPDCKERWLHGLVFDAANDFQLTLVQITILRSAIKCNVQSADFRVGGSGLQISNIERF